MKKIISAILAVLLVFAAPLTVFSDVDLSGDGNAFVSTAQASAENGDVALCSDWEIAEKNGTHYMAVTVYFTDCLGLKNWNLEFTYDTDIFDYFNKSDGKDAKAVKNYCDGIANSYTDESNAGEDGIVYVGGYFKESLWTAEEFLENSNFDGDCVVNSDNFESIILYLAIEDMEAFEASDITFTISGLMQFIDTGWKDINNTLSRPGDDPTPMPDPDPDYATDKVVLRSDWEIAEINGMPYVAVPVYFTNSIGLRSWNLEFTYDTDIFDFYTKADGKDAKAVKNYCDGIANSYTDESNAGEDGIVYVGGYFKENLWTAEDFLANSNFDGDCIVNSDNFEALIIYLEIKDMDAFEKEDITFSITGMMRFINTGWQNVSNTLSRAGEKPDPTPTPDPDDTPDNTTDKVVLCSDWEIAEKNGTLYIAVPVYFTNALGLKSWNLNFTYDADLFDFYSKASGKDAKAVKNYCDGTVNNYTDESNPEYDGMVRVGGYFKDNLWTAEEFLANSNFEGDCIVNSENFEALIIYLAIEDMDAFEDAYIEFTISGVMRFGYGDENNEINVSYTLDNACQHSETTQKVITTATCVTEGVIATVCTNCKQTLYRQTTSVDPSNHTGETEIGNVLVQPTEKLPGKGKVTCKSCNAVIGEDAEIPPKNSLGYGMCGENVRWVLNKNGTLYITGTGDMEDYYMTENGDSPDDYVSTAPWVAAGLDDNIRSVIIEDGVTSIGEVAFAQCYELTSVTMADTVTRINYGAFAVCLQLSEIDLSVNLVYIGEEAFVYCESLKEVILPDGLQAISYGMFGGSGLTEITVPDSVTQISYYAFSSCASLEKATLPEGLVSIGTGAFESCTSLTDVNIPQSVTEIPYGCFANCTDLENITLPNNVYAIYPGAFAYCSSLEKMTLPGSVEIIGWSAFEGCTAMEEIMIYNVNCEIDDSEETIPANATIKVFNDAQQINNFAEKYNRDIKKLTCSHSYKETIPDVESTCVTNGHTGGKRCTVCKLTMDPPESLPLGNHSISSYVDKEATHFEEGLKKYYCIYCGWDEEKVIEKLPDHAYECMVTDPTCTTPGYTLYICDCGHTETGNRKPALGHVDANSNGKCERCGGKYEPVFTQMIGDINGDEELTSIDARLCLRYAVDLEIPDEYQRAAADYNYDGEITSVDARLILRTAVGLD